MLVERPENVPPELVVDFDIYNPPGGEADYYKAWAVLQTGPKELLWTPRNGGHWIAVRGQAIEKIWSDHENFSSEIQIVPKAEGEEHKLIPTVLDPPQHTPYRAILNQALSPRRVMRWEKPIRALASSLIDELVPKGGCNFTTAYAEKLPILVFLDMCGLPAGDAVKLKTWTDLMVRPDGVKSREEIRQSFRSYLQPVIAERQADPGEDLISLLVSGEIMGRRLEMHEALQMCTSILFAGLDTVVNFLGFMMAFLAANEGHRCALAADRRLIPAAIEEFVRRFPIVTMGRMITRDQRFGGADLRAGEVVILPSVLHGIDDRENEKPLDVDFGRRHGRHSTFGQGAHRCVGLLLAKTEIRATLEEWFARIPEFHLVPGAEIRHMSGVVASVAEVPLVWDHIR